MLCIVLSAPPPPANALGDLPEYPARPAREYRAVQTKDGLSVALEPVVDQKTLKIYFKTDLVSRGFTPIFVVMENSNTSRSFTLLMDQVSISRHGLERQADEPREVHSGGSTAAEVAELASLEAAAMPFAAGVAIPPAAPALLVVALVVGSRAVDARHALVKNELRAQTLSPGGAAHGFLYFPMKLEKERIGDLVVRLTFLCAPENQRTVFELRLSDTN